MSPPDQQKELEKKARNTQLYHMVLGAAPAILGGGVGAAELLRSKNKTSDDTLRAAGLGLGTGAGANFGRRTGYWAGHGLSSILPYYFGIPFDRDIATTVLESLGTLGGGLGELPSKLNNE